MSKPIILDHPEQFKVDYCSNNMTYAELSVKYNTNPDIIAKWKNELNLSKKGTTINQIISDRQLEIINGSLLGDGTLTKVINNNRNSKFMEGHGLSQKEYLQWKLNELAPISSFLKDVQSYAPVNVNGKFIDADKNRIITTCVMSTYVNKFLTQLEKKWYLRDSENNYTYNSLGRRIKIVPSDLKLSPLSMAVWYMDDGTLCVTNRQAWLYTMGFTHNECWFLIELMKKTFNINYLNVVKIKNMYSILIKSRSFVDFIQIIKPNITDCMKYKVDLSLYKPPSIIYPEKNIKDVTDETAVKIRELFTKGMTYKKISQIVDVNKWAVRKIIKGESHLDPNFIYPQGRTNQEKGVYYTNTSSKNKWMATIKINNKTIKLGHFQTEQQAIKARQLAMSFKEQNVTDLNQYKQIKIIIKKQN